MSEMNAFELISNMQKEIDRLNAIIQADRDREPERQKFARNYLQEKVAINDAFSRLYAALKYAINALPEGEQEHVKQLMSGEIEPKDDAIHTIIAAPDGDG